MWANHLLEWLWFCFQITTNAFSLWQTGVHYSGFLQLLVKLAYFLGIYKKSHFIPFYFYLPFPFLLSIFAGVMLCGTLSLVMWHAWIPLINMFISWLFIFHCREIMFHVSTLLPYSSGDNQQVWRKNLNVLNNQCQWNSSLALQGSVTDMLVYHRFPDELSVSVSVFLLTSTFVYTWIIHRLF